MKNTLLISIFLIAGPSVLKSQDSIKSSAKTIEIIAPETEIVVEEEPVFLREDRTWQNKKVVVEVNLKRIRF